jgi:DNA modification methylase
MKIKIMQGDCIERMKELADNSVDSVVTDPPAGISFLGKAWDGDKGGKKQWIAWLASVMQECLRVLKPGGHALVWAIPRTAHWTMDAIDDAGFEIRDVIVHIFGSGFPKSLDVGKSLDAAEKKRWLDVCKALDNADQSAILAAWKEYSRTVSGAGLSFAKSETATGTNTPESGSVPASVLLQANPESNDAVALVAELSLTEAHRTSGATCNSAQSPAESSIAESRSLATSAASLPASPAATYMLDSFALQSAWGWQGESTTDKLKAAEALRIWLGSKPSSRQADISALCVALTADLKLITLSQSKTFQSFDTTRQTACASAISATITESTAESLISFTVDTLRSKAIDKELGCIRKPIRTQKLTGTARIKGGGAHSVSSATANYATHEVRDTIPITAPASPEAQQYDGWGTALKPATEHWILCRKPIETNNVASNVLKYGTGGINIEDCRVEGEGGGWNGKTSDRTGKVFSTGLKNAGIPSAPDGRWPANLTHDGTPEVEALFPYSKTGGKKGTPTTSLTKNTILRNAPGSRDGKEVTLAFRAANEGSASRFFNSLPPDDPAEIEEIQKAIYCKKASQKDRGGNNRHPTVKSTELMRFLCRLITPKGGTVLDPFMGSGSTGKAAILEGFSFIGIDKEPEYVIIAKERLIACVKSTQRKDKNES